MNILHVISSMDPRAGGPCQGIRNLRPLMQERGHLVEVVCLNDPDSEYLKEEIVQVHALGRGRGAWAYHPALRPWLEANLHRFDAVILNGIWQYPGFLLSRLAQRPDCPPYFIFPHGMLDPWFQRAPERRLKAIRNWFYWKLIEHRVISRAEAVLFTCAQEMYLAQKTFWPYRPKCQINVGYGVDNPPAFHERMTAAFAEKCPGLNGRPYLLFLSRIHEKKGIDLLLHAYAKVYGKKEGSGNEHGKSGERRGERGGQRTEDGGRRAEGGGQRSEDAAKAEIGKAESRNEDAEDRGQRTEDEGRRAEETPALVIAGPGLDTDYGRQMQRLAAELCEDAKSGERRAESGGRGPGLEVRGQRSEVGGQGAADGGQRADTAKAEMRKAESRNTEAQADPAVFFPGMLTGDAKWGAFYGCEAFVLPSHQENFGIAVAEALACGKPVLISNQINIWAEIAKDNAGIVEPDTAASTETLLQRWNRLTPEDRTAMGQAASACFEKRFGISQVARSLSTVLRKFARNRPPTTDH